MRKRTLARENVLKILYQSDIVRRSINAADEKYWSDAEDIDKVVQEYAKRLTSGIHQKVEIIDEMISKYATNWQLKRMAVIDRNILRMGVFEMMFLNDIPPKVAINEAVELAKKYGDSESSKFVNGILDKIHKTESACQNKKA